MAPLEKEAPSSPRMKKSILGNASLLIGIGLLVYLVVNYSTRHILGLQTAPLVLSVVGLVLGIVGVFQKGGNKKTAITGLLVNLGVIVVPILIILSWR